MSLAALRRFQFADVSKSLLDLRRVQALGMVDAAVEHCSSACSSHGAQPSGYSFTPHTAQSTYRPALNAAFEAAKPLDRSYVHVGPSFQSLWNEHASTQTSVQLPRSVTFLTGAPGAGKGVNLAFIQQILGADYSVGLSAELCKHSEASQHISQGALVPESLVARTFFETLFCRPSDGQSRSLLIDGFPRSASQVDFIKQMHDHFVKLRRTHPHLQAPKFEAIVLHLDESTSVERQRGRAEIAMRRNAAALSAPHGASELPAAVRESDVCATACSRRYELYRDSLGDVLGLRAKLPVHVIDAGQPVAASRDAIARALVT